MISAGSGLVVAEREEQQERAKKAMANESSSRREDLEIVNEAVSSWSTLDEHYYNSRGCHRTVSTSNSRVNAEVE